MGGIFDKPPDYRSIVRWSPETVLVNGLRERGHDVEAIGHFNRFLPGNFDVVHVHHLSWGALHAATDRTRTPFIFTMHASAPTHPSAASFVLKRADGVVALWAEEAELLSSVYGVDGADVRVIPNGIDPAVFGFLQPTHPRQGAWKVLFVGQLFPAKGVANLLEAIAGIRRCHRVELNLAYHTAIDEDALRRRAHELGLDDIVHFLGPTRQDELAAWYRASHIVVLPSHAEALPSVLTEAMLTGTYPVATNVGGIPDQLGGFGVVIPEATPEAIARGVERAIASYGTHCARAATMREVAEQRFSTQSMVSSHEDLYRGLVVAGRIPRRLLARKRMGTTLARPGLDMWMKYKVSNSVVSHSKRRRKDRDP